ncbi:MAG: hypothetical protein U5R06_23545 [candidate division KSB1 bacterium]|nr:hypothetical protein [candidate division KSB1 bacterium]
MMFEIIAIIASLISVLAVIYSFYTAKKSMSKAKKKISVMSEYYKSLIENDISNKELNEISYELISSLDNYVNIINKLHPNSRINASLQLLVNENNKANVVTFARDSKSARNRETFKYSYPISENTAFNSIISEKKEYFFSNNFDKPSDTIYNNSNNNDWILPYKSTFVLPIKKKSKENAEEIFGFLCVDSENRIEKDTALFDDIMEISKSTAIFIRTIIEAMNEKKTEHNTQ